MTLQTIIERITHRKWEKCGGCNKEKYSAKKRKITLKTVGEITSQKPLCSRCFTLIVANLGKP